MIAVDCRTRRLLHSRSVGTKPSVRFVTRAYEGHLKQYKIRYITVEPLFYSVCLPARVTNRTFRQLPLKGPWSAAFDRVRADAEHPSVIGIIREPSSTHVGLASSPIAPIAPKNSAVGTPCACRRHRRLPLEPSGH